MIDIQKTARMIEALIFASPAPVPRRALLPYLENEDQITEVFASIAARYDERSGIELSDIEGHYAYQKPLKLVLSENILILPFFILKLTNGLESLIDL